jgi:hypothetical protein
MRKSPQILPILHAIARFSTPTQAIDMKDVKILLEF